MIDILGISAFYHDSAACLLRDGEIIAAAQEERFNRKKHYSGFPSESIRYCLREGRTSLGDLRFPVQLLSTIPYLLTILAVAGFVGRSRPPAADGVPYESEGH